MQKKITIELTHKEQEYKTVADLQKDSKLTLCNEDDSIAIKNDYGKKYAEELSGYGCFFVEVVEGDFDRVYCCSHSIPWLGALVTRLKTPSEVVAEYVSKNNN